MSSHLKGSASWKYFHTVGLKILELTHFIETFLIAQRIDSDMYT